MANLALSHVVFLIASVLWGVFVFNDPPYDVPSFFLVLSTTICWGIFFGGLMSNILPPVFEEQPGEGL